MQFVLQGYLLSVRLVKPKFPKLVAGSGTAIEVLNSKTLMSNGSLVPNNHFAFLLHLS